MDQALLGGGEDGKLAELQAAAVAAVECGQDRQKFANECEPVLARFNRAVMQCKKDRKLLDSVKDKDSLVHFMIECVRNRFTFQRKVTQLKYDLSDASSEWSRAFSWHLMRCGTCRSVDLSTGAPRRAPTTKQPKAPIPFLFEVLAVCGLLLPLVAYFQGCDCIMRLILIALGLLLWLPLLVFEALWYYKRESVIWHLFIAGPYAVEAPVEPNTCFRCFWAPTVALLRVAVDDASPSKCLSWGHWGCSRWWPAGASVERTSVFAEEKAIKVTCNARQWSGKAAKLGKGGAVQGLSSGATCTGHSIVFEPARPGAEPQVWVKLGFRRLDFVRKTLIALAAIGLVCILTATCISPEGLLTCFNETPHVRTMFLVDASGSISDNEWIQERQAVVEMIDDFESRFERGKFHAGLVQFSHVYKLEVPLTDDIATVANTASTMAQIQGGTSFYGPVQECQRQLDNYEVPGNNTFDMCVLITDGACIETRAQLQGILKPETKLMGIFVGSMGNAIQFLKDISSCRGTDCPYFASATNFNELKVKIGELAEDISDIVLGACDVPPWVFASLLLLLPLVLWWLYLHTGNGDSPPADYGLHSQQAPKDRLRIAGGWAR